MSSGLLSMRNKERDLDLYDEDLGPLVGDLGDDIALLMDDLQSGSITADQWRERFAKMLAGAIALAYLVGLREPRFTSGDQQAAMQQVLAEQLAYLDRFYEEVRREAEFDPMWTARAQQYADVVTEAFWDGRTWPWPLPAEPGDGTSQCLTHCRCHWELDVLDDKKGDADAYWVLGPVEHCQTCIERAERWNPLQIRDWRLPLYATINKDDARALERLGAHFARVAERVALKHLAGKHDQKSHGRRAGANATDAQIAARNRAADERSSTLGSGLMSNPEHLHGRDFSYEAGRKLAASWNPSEETLATLKKEEGWPDKLTKEDIVGRYLEIWTGSSGGVVANTMLEGVQANHPKIVNVPIQRGEGVRKWLDAHPGVKRDLHDLGEAMYQSTQKYLAERGIEKITLYRRAMSHSARPFSSWSTDSSGYITTDAGLKLRRAVVPAAHIWSIPATGFGNIVEREVVVLGGNWKTTTKHLAGRHDQSRHGNRAGGEASSAQIAARRRAAAGRVVDDGSVKGRITREIIAKTGDATSADTYIGVMGLSREHFLKYAGHLGIKDAEKKADEFFAEQQELTRHAAAARWNTMRSNAFNGEPNAVLGSATTAILSRVRGKDAADAIGQLEVRGVRVTNNGMSEANAHAYASAALNALDSVPVLGKIIAASKGLVFEPARSGSGKAGWVAGDRVHLTDTFDANVRTLVHEFGHIAEEHFVSGLRGTSFGSGHTASMYGADDPFEDFAEWFTGMVGRSSAGALRSWSPDKFDYIAENIPGMKEWLE